MTTASPRTQAKVLAALSPTVGMSPFDVNAKVDDLSRVTIRHALRCLCESGEARYTGHDSNRLYFRTKETP